MRHSRGGGREGRSPTPNKHLGEQSPSAFLVLKISLAQHNNSQELPKKHHEAGLPEQMLTDALSRINYGHTRHCEDCKNVCLCNKKCKGHFEKIE